jgi:predicted lactoylglutathione lyase
MKQQSVSLVTLGVSDYERAKAFYSALGWTPALDMQQTAFYQANGVVLVLWVRERLSEDCGIADEGATWSGVALAHNVASREEVDAIVDLAQKNGATVTREPSETFYGGYAGVFCDPDDHVWEIAHNPGFGLREDGSLLLPTAATDP